MDLGALVALDIRDDFLQLQAVHLLAFHAVDHVAFHEARRFRGRVLDDAGDHAGAALDVLADIGSDAKIYTRRLLLQRLVFLRREVARVDVAEGFHKSLEHAVLHVLLGDLIRLVIVIVDILLQKLELVDRLRVHRAA